VEREAGLQPGKPFAQFWKMIAVGVEFAVGEALQFLRRAAGHGAKAFVDETDAQAVARPAAVGDQHAFAERAERAGQQGRGGPCKARAAGFRGWTFFFQDGRRG